MVIKEDNPLKKKKKKNFPPTVDKQWGGNVATKIQIVVERQDRH